MARRLTTVEDTVGGQCTTRVYAFTGTSGKASNRTSLTSYNPNADGTCQTTTAASTRNYTYDSADRITSTGTVYDALGRTFTTPAADTALPANGDVTMTYQTNDMARTVSQNGRTNDYTLDVIANRFRSWTDNATGSTVTRTHHYSGDSDKPAWTDEGNGTWTRTVKAIAGLAAVQTGPAAGNSVWQMNNLHGDLVAGVVAGTPGLAYTSEQTEFGQPRVATDVGLSGNSYAAKPIGADTATVPARRDGEPHPQETSKILRKAPTRDVITDLHRGQSPTKYPKSRPTLVFSWRSWTFPGRVLAAGRPG